ncbi:MAG: DNA translocase FtsK, partial [Candidatus Eisenbacteria bacterium]
FARKPVRRLALETLLLACLLCSMAQTLALVPGLSREGAQTLSGSFGVSLADRTKVLLGSFGATLVSLGLFAILILAALEGRLIPGMRRLSLLGRLAFIPEALGRLAGGWFKKFLEKRTPRVTMVPRIQPAERGIPRAGAPVREPAREQAPGLGASSPLVSGGDSRALPRESAATLPEPQHANAGLVPGQLRKDARAGAASEASKIPTQEPLPLTGPGFSLPPLSLLDEPSGPETYMSRDEILESSKRIEERLTNFGVEGRVVEVHPGPVITRFDFEPGTGVTVNQIVSRADDLALGLRVPRIRLLTPVPGKAAVGIEVPNTKPSVVYIKELLSAPAFHAHESRLVLALGKDTSGNCFYTELARMPHLLIAGATGSGKSVCINSIVLSLLYRLSPKELSILMIDPKKLELTAYNGTPHLVAPVVSDAREASRSLRWVVKEMEQRYLVLAGKGVRNIDGFNERAREEGAEGLPYLVVIIDELADLMCMLPTEIEEPISRLAQMARAVGIHLILATQRPSVDVITGVIKANFPTRLAFQVASKVDSRTILDMNGAETLLGNGDMLFFPSGRPEPLRLHGAYVSEKDVERVVAYLREFGWMRKQLVDLKEAGSGLEGESDSDDQLLEEAARIVITHSHGSVSLLQRRLKIGYSRAARLMDRLEEMGIVGPADGSKPREVLANDSLFEEGGLFEKKSQSSH